LHEFEPDTDAYITPTALRLRGQLDTAALQAALTGLVARHESLRTTFEPLDGQGGQLVHPPYPVALPITDLSASAPVASTLPESAPAASTPSGSALPAPAGSASAGSELGSALRQALLDDGRRPFDLAAGPVLRVRLLRLAADDHVLSLTLPHIST